jgi:hypothetical protein
MRGLTQTNWPLMRVLKEVEPAAVSVPVTLDARQVGAEAKFEVDTKLLELTPNMRTLSPFLL